MTLILILILFVQVQKGSRVTHVERYLGYPSRCGPLLHDIEASKYKGIPQFLKFSGNCLIRELFSNCHAKTPYKAYFALSSSVSKKLSLHGFTVLVHQH